jgi:TRAP transporter TAXI family solute receptor
MVLESVGWRTACLFAIATIGLSSVGALAVSAQSASTADRWSQWQAKTHLVISAGRSNFPRLAAWLLNSVNDQFPDAEFSGEILFTGSGYGIELKNIQRKVAQLAITTPPATAHMSYNGVGIFPQANPNLRGFFRIGQRDPITFAVPADMGVNSVEDLIQRKVPVKIATGHVDGDDTTGFLFAEVIKAYGVSIAQLQAWGGQVVPFSWAGPALRGMIAGKADSIFHEASVINQPLWKPLNEQRPMRVLSIRQDVIDAMSKFGFRKYDRIISKGSYPGILDDVVTIDYSDWIVVGDASIPDDLAYKIAKGAAEGVNAWNRQDPSLNTEESGALGNLRADPKTMWKNIGVPLHPGAERYFREKGLMP